MEDEVVAIRGEEEKLSYKSKEYLRFKESLNI
jgi:hypothetical protein